MNKMNITTPDLALDSAIKTMTVSKTVSPPKRSKGRRIFNRFIVYFLASDLDEKKESKNGLRLFLTGVNSSGLKLVEDSTKALQFSEAILAINYLSNRSISPRIRSIARVERVLVNFKPERRKQSLINRLLSN